jgi:protein O-mannosyl-transferase
MATSSSAWRPFAGLVILVLAVLAIYANSLSVPFIYDDVPAISGNPSIQSLSPLWPVLFPPAHLTTSGRPIVNVTLALNYAFSGTDVRSYHALNIAIHVLATLTLFGLVRRTLGRPVVRERIRNSATSLAFAIAALWALHPLQTEAVTYIVQRAESLVGLFYLLTLYCFARLAEVADGTTDPSSSSTSRGFAAMAGWGVLCVTSCILGMASKEVMASAPLIVLLYDRTFVAGTFAESWRRRRWLYVSLAATWVLLGWLFLSTGGTRDGSAGFGQGMAWWEYALTQAKAIVLYLRLSLVPYPLIFDYGNATVPWPAALPYLTVVAALLGATFVAVWRWPSVAFLAIGFFAILAPSSSIVPVVTETMAEHRMYLPLAAVATLVVLAAHAWLGRWTGLVSLGAALVLAVCTVRRNEVYHSHVALWADAVAKLPTNGRAHNQLGSALTNAGREPDALREYAEALRLQPTDAKAHFNFATALSRAGRGAESVPEFEAALRLERDNVDVHTNYGVALMQLGRRADAIAHYRVALHLDPSYAPAHNNLGVALGSAGELTAAITEFQAALRERHDYVEAHNNLGHALAETGHPLAAIAEFETAVRLFPDYGEAHNNLARAYEAAGQFSLAAQHYREVVRLVPTYADGHCGLARTLLHLDRPVEALVEFETTLRLAPDNAEAQREIAALRPTSTAKGSNAKVP